jgi:hypothetical protein
LKFFCDLKHNIKNSFAIKDPIRDSGECERTQILRKESIPIHVLPNQPLIFAGVRIIAQSTFIYEEIFILLEL